MAIGLAGAARSESARARGLIPFAVDSK